MFNTQDCAVEIQGSSEQNSRWLFFPIEMSTRKKPIALVSLPVAGKIASSSYFDSWCDESGFLITLKKGI